TQTQFNAAREEDNPGPNKSDEFGDYRASQQYDPVDNSRTSRHLEQNN
ncbi:unnamed protein product, partial [Onchocerca ochengi]